MLRTTSPGGAKQRSRMPSTGSSPSPWDTAAKGRNGIRLLLTEKKALETELAQRQDPKELAAHFARADNMAKVQSPSRI